MKTLLDFFIKVVTLTDVFNDVGRICDQYSRGL